MSDTLWAAIVGGGAGIVTGTLSSILAPWVNWRIEQRRNKIIRRTEQIHRWREMIMGWRFYSAHNKPTTLHLDLERGWISLKPHLKASVIQEVAQYQEREISYAELEKFVNFMLCEIEKLERKWKLV